MKASPLPRAPGSKSPLFSCQTVLVLSSSGSRSSSSARFPPVLSVRCCSHTNASTTSVAAPAPRDRTGAVRRRKRNLDVDRSQTPQPLAQTPPPKNFEECVPSAEEASISVRSVYQGGDPLGRKELGKCVVRWIGQGMRAMAYDLASAEVQDELPIEEEVRQRLGLVNGGSTTGGLAFVIQAQPYLYAVPMPKGLEALCFKACAHYPTLFDHFQRELRDVLQDLQLRGLIPDWRATQSWKLLKEFAASGEAETADSKDFIFFDNPLRGKDSQGLSVSFFLCSGASSGRPEISPAHQGSPRRIGYRRGEGESDTGEHRRPG